MRHAVFLYSSEKGGMWLLRVGEEVT